MTKLIFHKAASGMLLSPSPPTPVGVQYSRIVPALLNVLKRQGDAIAALEARIVELAA